jgi:hypothetical protein
LFQNKINLRYCASGWFYYRNYFRHVGIKRYITYCKHPYDETPGMPVPVGIHQFGSNSETVMQTSGTP